MAKVNYRERLATAIAEERAEIHHRAWELLPFDFRLNWVYTLEYGWLEFCWLPGPLDQGEFL